MQTVVVIKIVPVKEDETYDRTNAEAANKRFFTNLHQIEDQLMPEVDNYLAKLVQFALTTKNDFQWNDYLSTFMQKIVFHLIKSSPTFQALREVNQVGGDVQEYFLKHFVLRSINNYARVTLQKYFSVEGNYFFE